MEGALRRPEAVLFDLDGTLYDERRLRRAMVPRLLIGAALGGGPRLLRCIQAYRRTREGLRGESFPTGAALEALHLERAAALAGSSPDEVRSLVEEWLEQRPLRHLGRAARPGLLRTVRGLRERGIRVGVFSDHPTVAKLEALGLDGLVEAQCSATSEGVGALKPDPAGFLHLARELEVAPRACLVVGDRDDCDGAAARAAGMDFRLMGDRLAGDEVVRLGGLPELLVEIDAADG